MSDIFTLTQDKEGGTSDIFTLTQDKARQNNIKD
jgi:hypothetical protein